METSEANVWKKCSRCKKGIPFSTEYFVCSVSTCNGMRTGYVFCDMNCFESHLPGARHRDAGAIRKTSPPPGGSVATAPSAAAATPRPPTRIIPKSQPAVSSAKPRLPHEVLIIASRLKEYIQASADMNTSAGVMDVLSDYVRVLAERAIDNARADGRKTVMDRDFDFLKQTE